MAGKSTSRTSNKNTPKPKEEASGSGKPLSKALGPAAEDFGKEIKPLGKELGEVTVRSVRALLIRPLSGIANGAEYCGELVSRLLADKLSRVPEENIVEPQARIAWPALQAFSYAGDDEVIREMFVNLMASDMNTETKSSTHPAFVEIINQMTGFEAKVLKKITESGGDVRLERRRMISADHDYNTFERVFSFEMEGRSNEDIDIACGNLARLGLIEITSEKYPTSERLSAFRDKFKKEVNDAYPPEGVNTNDVGIDGIFMVPLGRRFAEVCLS